MRAEKERRDVKDDIKELKMVKWAYILIGDSRTGKTRFQKELIQHIGGDWYTKLDCNQFFDIDTRIGTRNAKKISFMNRSFQEKEQTIQEFFDLHFAKADIAILASHLIQADITDMIHELKSRYYNVCGVFFDNSIAANGSLNSTISSQLDWDERYYVENPKTDNGELSDYILRRSALEFAIHIFDKI